jgi:hypothetical protein
MKEYVKQVLVPYRKQCIRDDPCLKADQKAMLVLDCWSVHRGPFTEWMKKVHPEFQLLFIPARTTTVFQPCDVGIMQPFKSAMRNALGTWVVQQVAEHMASASAGVSDLFASLPVAELRNLCVTWMLEAVKNIKPDTVRASWQNRARLLDAFEVDIRKTARARFEKGKLFKGQAGVEPAGHEELQEAYDEWLDNLPLAQLAAQKRAAKAAASPAAAAPASTAMMSEEQAAMAALDAEFEHEHVEGGEGQGQGAIERPPPPAVVGVVYYMGFAPEGWELADEYVQGYEMSFLSRSCAGVHYVGES